MSFFDFSFLCKSGAKVIPKWWQSDHKVMARRPQSDPKLMASASGGGLVHLCYELFGAEMAGAMLSSFARLFTVYWGVTFSNKFKPFV